MVVSFVALVFVLHISFIGFRSLIIGLRSRWLRNICYQFSPFVYSLDYFSFCLLGSLLASISLLIIGFYFFFGVVKLFSTYASHLLLFSLLVFCL